jgi:hypothetical protein
VHGFVETFEHAIQGLQDDIATTDAGSQSLRVPLTRLLIRLTYLLAAGELRSDEGGTDWDRIRRQMASLEGTGPSSVFEPGGLSELEDLQIGRTALRLAVGALGGVLERARSDEFGRLERLLGGVYELLLAGPQPIPRSSRASSRRDAGAYYTPDPLVRHVVQTALDPAIAEARNTPDPVQSLLRLRVVDPACGSGRFLFAATSRIANALIDVAGGELDHLGAVKAVADSCIFGVDIDPTATELCRTLIAIETSSWGSVGSIAAVAWGDSLLGTTASLIADGIPALAFTPVDDDEPRVALSRQKKNEAELGGQGSLFFKEGGVTDESALDLGLQADAWCAAFLVRKDDSSPTITTASIREATEPRRLSAEVAQALDNRRPIHWHRVFPEVFRNGGFDVVIGNPPFLNQLESRSASGPRLMNLLRARFGDFVDELSDSSTLFFLLALEELAKAKGGRVCLVLPDSFLSVKSASGARALAASCGELTALWVAGERLFDASVYTCAPTLKMGIVDSHRIERYIRSGFTAIGEITVRELPETWSELIAPGFGIPEVQLNPSVGLLAEISSATADFRDQYYKLAPFVVEEGATEGGRSAPLVTVGLIDPARLLWGRRSTRFHGVRFERPVVDLDSARSDSAVATWLEKRRVPKVMLATQTKVLEAVVDESGTAVPSVPVISIITDEPWKVAAVLMSPPVTALAAARYLGSALSASALKLSASQVGALPLPPNTGPWERAASRVRDAQYANSEADWRAAIEDVGTLMCLSYGIAPGGEVFRWWADRLPAWRS